MNKEDKLKTTKYCCGECIKENFKFEDGLYEFYPCITL